MGDCLTAAARPAPRSITEREQSCLIAGYRIRAERRLWAHACCLDGRRSARRTSGYALPRRRRFHAPDPRGAARTSGVRRPARGHGAPGVLSGFGLWPVAWGDERPVQEAGDLRGPCVPVVVCVVARRLATGMRARGRGPRRPGWGHRPARGGDRGAHAVGDGVAEAADAASSMSVPIAVTAIAAPSRLLPAHVRSPAVPAAKHPDLKGDPSAGGHNAGAPSPRGRVAPGDVAPAPALPVAMVCPSTLIAQLTITSAAAGL